MNYSQAKRRRGKPENRVQKTKEKAEQSPWDRRLHAGGPYWPSWFPFLDRGALREMRSCCPECDMLADWIGAATYRFRPSLFYGDIGTDITGTACGSVSAAKRSIHSRLLRMMPGGLWTLSPTFR